MVMVSPVITSVLSMGEVITADAGWLVLAPAQPASTNTSAINTGVKLERVFRVIFFVLRENMFSLFLIDLAPRSRMDLSGWVWA
jgi:hypothetical protein